ncbi:MAG TPA: apolipoprotein N-acyltransferase [Actinomycetota bacterium]|nr:apolipoprotein N-acyltransferase [Actinomycetota bacterium]
MSRGRAPAIALLSGAALAFAFPGAGVAPLAWISLAPLLAIVRGRSTSASLRLGFLFGIGFFGVLLIWIKHVGWIPWLLLVLMQSVFTAGFGAAWARLSVRFRGLGAAAGAAALWVAVEYIRANMPVVGFTWGEIAQSQTNLPWMLPIAGITGAWGITFLVVAVNALVVEVARELKEKDRKHALVYMTGCVVLLAAPAAIPAPDSTGAPVSVAIAQGNVPEPFDGTITEKSIAILNSHVSLTAELAGEDVDLVVWPESAVGVDMNRNDFVGESVSGAAATADAEMIVGGNLDTEDGNYQVLAFHIGPDGEVVERYQKTHLVPFGEYVPGRAALDWVPMLDQVPRDAIAGTEPGLFEIEQGPVAPVISFEGDFGSLVRARMGEGGGRLLVVATNTSTWGESWASIQHVAFSRLRAAENGTWVVHAALSGVSAFIAPDGSVTQTADLWTRALLRETVHMSDGPTFYGRVGDWLPILCLLVSLVDLVLASRRRAGTVA